jgi:bifunctional non-homologous end joining protein LigD
MPEQYDPKLAYTPPASWDTERILPEGFLPMLAAAATALPEGADYAYEVKWEGLRVLVGFEGAALAARTAAGQDARVWFPELEAVRSAAPPDWVLLDGELLVLRDGRPSPEDLRRRSRASGPEQAEELAAEVPATFVIYDILRIGDSWLLDVNWDERREILERVVVPTSAAVVSPVFNDGEQALSQSRALGLEAVVAKRVRGRYTPGERTRDWLSVKPQEVVEAVICGWTEGRGVRAGAIGSLLLGARRDGRLVYIGHTGTGLDSQTLPYLHRELKRRARRTSPFDEELSLNAPPNWVRPELVCRVRHQGWTETGKMRSPTFLGMVDRIAVGS